jgi:hypothetical protein
MASDRPKTGKRAQVYIDARHRAWWDALPRYDRSRIVAEALDLYRNQRETDDKRSVKGDHPDNSAS